MANLILADRNEGRIIAGLVTSLVFHWHRLPIGLQTAIISHASETGFAQSDLSEQADQRIIGFIRMHHEAVREGVPERNWAPHRLWSAWLRQRRLVQDVDIGLPNRFDMWFRRSWADRSDEASVRRHGVGSEIARGLARARILLGRIFLGSR